MNTLHKYEQLLKEFNWTYQYDTDEEYAFGKKKHDEIKETLGQLNESQVANAYKLFNKNAPAEFNTDYANFLVEWNMLHKKQPLNENIKLGKKKSIIFPKETLTEGKIADYFKSKLSQFGDKIKEFTQKKIQAAMATNPALAQEINVLKEKFGGKSQDEIAEMLYNAMKTETPVVEAEGEIGANSIKDKIGKALKYLGIGSAAIGVIVMIIGGAVATLFGKYVAGGEQYVLGASLCGAAIISSIVGSSLTDKEV